MKRSFAYRALALLAIVLPLLATSACAPRADDGAGDESTVVIAPALLPAPASMETRSGQFTVQTGTPVHAQGDAASRVANRFVAYLGMAGKPQPKLAAGEGEGGIRFAIEATRPDASPEAYTLDIATDGITVKAADERGLFYGAVTLWQLIAQGQGERIVLPALYIEDAPRFGWRGFMLDSARHFQSVDEVKKILDAMALHKLNTFHWHLTDDQGWRIEIKQYPRLTEIGGCRIPAGDGGKDPKTGAPRPYCGFYTQDQIRDVVKYAAERHITVVPEINVPGHATAAIAAYPEIGTIDTPLVPSSEWGVFPNLVNTEESTYQFFENVLGEVVTLFPGAYVHVGGDEAVKDQWEASARVQQRMREVGAKDEMAMQGHLVERLEKFLAGHGKRLIGWDEILEAKLPAEATVMSWRGIEGGLQAARQGHDVVMSPSSETYLDYLQTDSPNEPPGRPATITLEQVYAFEPVPAELEDSQKHHILGLQANLWTEHTRTFARLQHNAFPRLAAVAETGWTPAAKKDFTDFTARLPAQLRRYDAIGLAYARTPFEPSIAVEDDRAAGTARVTLGNALGYAIHYTTDGGEPNAQSPKYDAPLDIEVPTTLHAAVFANGRALAPASVFDLSAASMLTRTDETLSVCPDTGRLLLRLEDDGPADGERAIFNATIFYPCWQWNQADLDGIASIKVRAGRIPYYFQLAHDEPHRTFEPAKSPLGELEILGGGCKGHTLATVPMPAAPDADGFLELDAPLPAGTSGKQDLCLRFTGDTRPQMWVLDRVTLRPR
ncbi:family 20 glycosylhydrolase [Pseudoxanthomonas putridarboris]|uniref:beta-N-acetylhexosaminidase n=1 Tax=Pseudoxanthomonas putridarboris TaxID=752605 RepID=A0ABU9IW81_9GAMM